MKKRAESQEKREQANTWVPLNIITRQTSKVAIERAFEQSLKLRRLRQETLDSQTHEGRKGQLEGLSLPAIEPTRESQMARELPQIKIKKLRRKQQGSLVDSKNYSPSFMRKTEVR